MIFCLPFNNIAFSRTKLMLPVVFILMAVVLSPGCLGRKKAEETTIEKQDNSIQDAIKSLKALMTDNGMTIQQKRTEWNRIKNLNLMNAEVDEWLGKVDLFLNQEERRMAEEILESERLAAQKEKAKKSLQNLMAFFERIASAPNADEANRHIQEALSLFSSAQVPVLIVISTSSNGAKDYDRPTTIRKYLDYIKDQRKYERQAEPLKLDDQGKIKELELIKQ